MTYSEGKVVTRNSDDMKRIPKRKFKKDKYIFTAGGVLLFILSFLILGILEGEDTPNVNLEKRIKNRDVKAQLKNIEKIRKQKLEKEKQIKDEIFLGDDHDVLEIADEIIGRLKKKEDHASQEHFEIEEKEEPVFKEDKDSDMSLFSDFDPDSLNEDTNKYPIESGLSKAKKKKRSEKTERKRSSLIAWSSKKGRYNGGSQHFIGSSGKKNSAQSGLKSNTRNKNEIIYNRHPVVKIFEGSFIDGVLANTVVTDKFESPVVCRVTRDFCDETGKYVVIPSNSKIIGTAAAVVNNQNSRLIIRFHRIILPNGISILIESEKERMIAAGPDGGMGVKGKKNSHLLKKYGSALFYGLLSGVGRVLNGAGQGSRGTSIFVGRSSENFELLNERIAAENMSVLPTISLKPGSEMKIYISRDILISAYSVIEPVH